jgi:hypothetical protein
MAMLNNQRVKCFFLMPHIGRSLTEMWAGAALPVEVLCFGRHIFLKTVAAFDVAYCSYRHFLYEVVPPLSAEKRHSVALASCNHA